MKCGLHVCFMCGGQPVEESTEVFRPLENAWVCHLVCNCTELRHCCKRQAPGSSTGFAAKLSAFAPK